MSTNSSAALAILTEPQLAPSPDAPDLHHPPAVEHAEQLAECERELSKIFHEGFFRAGEILRKIRDEELYLGSHASFEEYLEDRWDNTINYANRVINAAMFCERIIEMPIGTLPLPTAESQVRPLLRLKDPTKQTVAWEKAVENAAGRVPHAWQVQEVVDGFLPPKKPKSVKPSAERVEAEPENPKDDNQAVADNPLPSGRLHDLPTQDVDNNVVTDPVTNSAPGEVGTIEEVSTDQPASTDLSGETVKAHQQSERSSGVFPNGLVDAALQLTKGMSSKVPGEHNERRQRFVVAAAESIDRVCKEDESLTLKDALNALKYALAMLEKAREKLDRKKGKK